MTKSLLSAFALSAAFLAGAAQASVDLGGAATLFPIATATAKYNDNIFLSSANAKSDSILELAPGIQIIADTGVTKTQFSYSENFQFYSSQSSLNAALADVSLMSRYDDAKLKIDLEGWFRQLNQATRNVAGTASLVRRDLKHGALLGESSLTEKTSVSLGFTYDETNYKPAGYVSWKYWDLPVKYYYEIEPKLDLSAGFRYRDNQLDTGAADSTEYFYSIGARGDLAPKATGEISVGLNQRRLNVGGTKNGLGIESNFTYAYSEKTSLNFGLHNSYGYSGTGDSYTDFGWNIGARAAISSDLTVGGAFTYSTYDYTGAREDDFYQGEINATYLINAYVTLSGAYSYAKNDSTLASSDFTNNIFSVSAKFRY